MTTGKLSTAFLALGIDMDGGSGVASGGSIAAEALRAFWIKTASMMTSAAMASTIGTARGTTQGSCRPRVARVPSTPW